MRNAVQSPAPAAVAGAIVSWGLALRAPGRTGSPLMITRPPPGLTAFWVALGSIGSALVAEGETDRGAANAASATARIGDAVGDAFWAERSSWVEGAFLPGPIANHNAAAAIVAI